MQISYYIISRKTMAILLQAMTREHQAWIFIKKQKQESLGLFVTSLPHYLSYSDNLHWAMTSLFARLSSTALYAFPLRLVTITNTKSP